MIYCPGGMNLGERFKTKIHISNGDIIICMGDYLLVCGHIRVILYDKYSGFCPTTCCFLPLRVLSLRLLLVCLRGGYKMTIPNISYLLPVIAIVSIVLSLLDIIPVQRRGLGLPPLNHPFVIQHTSPPRDFNISPLFRLCCL